MILRIQITPGSALPIYQQITDQVRRAVATGELAVGDQLPSVRHLAQSLTVNPNTVARAYHDLTREGVVETQKGVGVFISRKRKIFTRKERLLRLRPKMEELIQAAMALDFDEEELRKLMDSEMASYPIKRKVKP